MAWVAFTRRPLLLCTDVQLSGHAVTYCDHWYALPLHLFTLGHALEGTRLVECVMCYAHASTVNVL